MDRHQIRLAICFPYILLPARPPKAVLEAFCVLQTAHPTTPWLESTLRLQPRAVQPRVAQLPCGLKPYPTIDEYKANQTLSAGYCDSRWMEATALCESKLNEEELGFLGRIKTLEDFKRSVSSLQSSIQQLDSSVLLQRLLPLLEPFIGFITLLAAYISSSSVETTMMWGMMSLLLRV